LEEYQGWANFPTWAVFRWLTAESVSYVPAVKIALAEPDDNAAAERLKKWWIGGRPDWGPSYWDEIVVWANELVDWLEIARALRE